jgi:hypothetical protein
LRSRGWDETLTEFYPRKARECPAPKTNATIGDFLAEVQTLHTSKARTIEGYAVALRKIVADIAGLESGRRGGDPSRHKAWRETPFVQPSRSSANGVTVIAGWGLCRTRRGLGGKRFEQCRHLARSVVPGKFPSQLSCASAVRGLREDAIDCVTHLLRRRIVGR